MRMGGELGRSWEEEREGNYNQGILCKKKNLFSITGENEERILMRAQKMAVTA